MQILFLVLNQVSPVFSQYIDCLVICYVKDEK